MKRIINIKTVLLLTLLGVCFTTLAQDWNELQKIVASDRGTGDNFGATYSEVIAIEGDYAIVGASFEDHDATGGNFASNAGSVYIFKNTNGIWSQVQKIVASDRAAEDQFGTSVAISGDYIVVGAFNEDEDATGANYALNAGSAYIFKNTSGTWSQVQKIVASDREAYDAFGVSVAISGDYVIVGASGEDQDVVGANYVANAGSAYIFKNTSGTWSEVQKIGASDRGAQDNFGVYVAISGDYAFVGVPWEDEDVSGNNYMSVAGSAYIFKNTSGTWSQVQKIVASDRAAGDQFGTSVAMSGDYVIIGAFAEDEDATGANYALNAGSAYIFKNTSGTWSEVQKIVTSDRAAGDYFSVSLAISGDYAIVSAYGQDYDAAGANYVVNSGAAYIFKNTSGTWSEVQKIVASDRATSDNFGFAVAISSDYIIVGARSEDHDAAGANYVQDAGSAYIFRKGCAGDEQLALVADSTYTSAYSNTDGNGWTHYCSSGGELLLSLDTTGTGAIVDDNQVQIKLGINKTYSYDTANGVVDNTNGYIMMERVWDVIPTSQPSTGEVGVKFYFTNEEYDSLVIKAANHTNKLGNGAPTTISAVTDIQFYKGTGSVFAYPHDLVSIVEITNGATPDTVIWKYAAKGSDHSAEFLVSSFSGGAPIVGAGDNPLPVDLVSFTTKLMTPTTAILEWTTGTEINNDYFDIERSIDGFTFELIDRHYSKAENGNSNSMLNYTYLDNQVTNNNKQWIYYRLKQVDFNGEQTYSKEKRVSLEQGLEVIIQPNPTRNVISVYLNRVSGVKYLQLSDSKGVSLYHKQVNEQTTFTIDASQYSPGIYILQIIGDHSQVQNKKIIIR